MSKTILLPSDFSIQSLNLLITVLKDREGEKFHIILGQGFRLSSSIIELLFFSRSKMINSLTSTEFREALQIVKSKYESQILDLRIEPFYGVTQSAFDIYAQSNNIEEVFVFDGYKPHFNHVDCFDISPFLTKAKVQINRITVNTLKLERKGRETFTDLSFSKLSRYNQ
tara:strand:- start:1825 stop:2331 length:507 start_codon:yes stop_codon:yes gene_type:complete